MLEYFGHQTWAEQILRAIEDVLTEKKVLTPDLEGSATTGQVGDAIAEKLQQLSAAQ